MISSFEVGAIFGIKDDATATLLRMADQVKAFDKIVIDAGKHLAELGKIKFPGLSGELKALGEQAETLKATFGLTTKSMVDGTGAAIAAANDLAAAWGRAASSAKAAAAAMNTSGIAGAGATASAFGVNPRQRVAGSHGGSNVHSYASLPMPGGMHVRGNVGGTGTMIAGGLGLYSIYDATTIADDVSKGLANVYPEGNPADIEMKKKELTAAIVKQAGITKLPLQTVAKMALDEIKTNANQPWEARMHMLPLVIQSSAREAYTKGTSPEAATSAFVGQLHQIRAFTPAEVEKYGPMLAYFASKDPNALVNIARSGGYHTPIATSLMGIPIEQDLAAQTILDRTGVGGKAGTWLREIATRAGKPVKDKFYAGKMSILQDFGLMGADEHATWMTDGRFDEQKMLHILHDKLQGIPVEEKAGRLKQIFGERGSMGIALLTEDKMLKQYDEVLAEARKVMPNAEWWAQQNATNPMQKMKGALVDAQIAALSAGQILSPLGVGAASAASSSLGWAAGILPEPGSAGEKRGETMGAWGLAGGVFGAGVGLLGGPPGVVGGAVLGTAIGAEVGYLVGTFKMLDDAAKGAGTALQFLWKYGPGTGGRPSDGGEAKPEKHSMNFIPPPKDQKPIVLTSSIKIDGQTLAEAVSEKLASLYEFPTQSANADGMVGYWAPDQQTVST